MFLFADTTVELEDVLRCVLFRFIASRTVHNSFKQKDDETVSAAAYYII